MKKFLVTTCGAIIIGLLMISSATAVPKVNSDPLMDIITDIEKNKQLIEENISNKTLDLKTRESINLLINKIKDTICNITPNPKLGGLIDLLIKIIQFLITFIQQLISVISAIYNIVELIYTLITVLSTLYNLILQLIQFIQDILNPQPLKST
jgi:phage-related protein